MKGSRNKKNKRRTRFSRVYNQKRKSKLKVVFLKMIISLKIKIGLELTIRFMMKKRQQLSLNL